MIINLIEQRKRIHDHFKKYEVIIEEEKIASVDQKFLRKTIELINEHLSDFNFSVAMLADNLAVSRSLLHKKLVVLLGEPPRELIRRIRLNKAAKLIEQRFGNISEIALEVGFNNPSYFAECFQKQFGFSPSQYHHNLI
jgi:AraC-like DNA-binding protein